MRERKPGDWTVDLAGRHMIESLVERTLERIPEVQFLRSSTQAYDRLDFQLLSFGDRLIELEVKAKHQHLSSGWQQLRPDVVERDLFVLDELALRKIVDAGRYAFLLIRDAPSDRWVLFSAGDLLVASRVRHARRIEKSAEHRMKGKLLFDLAEAGYESRTLSEVMDVMLKTTRRLDLLWSDVAPWPAVGS